MTQTRVLHVGLVLAGILAGIAVSPFINSHGCWGLLHYPSSPVSSHDLPTTDVLSTSVKVQLLQQRAGELVAAPNHHAPLQNDVAKTVLAWYNVCCVQLKCACYG